MHAYLPEKYRSSFFHGVFLFSKVGVLVVNFDGLFTLAYSNHILWFWPLVRARYHHTSLSSTLLSQGLPILPDIFLRKGIIEPALPGVFLFPLSLIMPPKCSIRIWGWGYVKVSLGFLYKEMFSCKIFGTSKLFHHKNHFDIDSKETRSEEIQVILMERFSEVMKTFLFCFWWKIWSDI
jgi:hypothetical protein